MCKSHKIDALSYNFVINTLVVVAATAVVVIVVDVVG